MKKPVYKRWWFWTLVVLVVVVVGIRIALDPVASHFTQQGLDKLEGYTGKFESVHVSVIPPGYEIHKLEIRQNDSKLKDPLVYVEDVDAYVILRKLLKGQIVAVASVKQPKLAYGMGDFKPPEIEGAKPEPKKQKSLDLEETMGQIIPLRIDRLEVRDGELLFVDATDAKAPRFWVKDIELAVDNIATRRSLDENVPVAMTMSATVQKSGKLSVMANADVLQKMPAFTGQAELKGLKLEHIYEFAAAKAGLSPKGTFDCFVNFNSAEGKLSGAIKPMIKNAEIEAADDKFINVVKAKLADVALDILSDRVPDRNAVATTLPIKGTLTKPDPQIWPTVLGVVRNAFVEGFANGFYGLPPPAEGSARGDRPEGKPQPKQTRR